MTEGQKLLLEQLAAYRAERESMASNKPLFTGAGNTSYANNNILTQLGVGVDNLQASLQRSIAGANTLLGNEDTAFTRSIMESAELNSRNAAAANFIPDSIPGAALAYTAQATPGIAAMAAGGWAGLGAKAAGGLAARALGVTLPEVAGAGAAAGLTGATLANLPQHYGENINAQMENGATLGEASTGAIAPALTNTTLDTASTALGLGALSKAAKPYRDAGMSPSEAIQRVRDDLRSAPAKAALLGAGAVGVELGTEGAQQAVTLSMDPNSPFAFMDPGYNAKVVDAAYAGLLTAGTIQSPGIAVNAARALAPTPTVNETPQTGTVDVVDPATGAVLGSSTGELGSNNGPLMSADFTAMNEADAQPTQYPQAEDPLLSAIRDDMGGRAVTINPIAENYLVHNLGITPTDAVSALSAVAPDEVENRTWSSDAVLKAASRIMEQQAQAQRDATIPTDGITEQDAIQGLLGQLRQTADIKSAFETARTRADDTDVRLNSLIAMEERDAVRRGLETAQNQPDIGRAARDRAANEIARYNYERQQLLANQPAGTIHDMFGDGLFTEPNIKQSVEEEKAPFSVPPASAQSWLFDRNGNVTPAAQQVRDWEDNRPDEAALAAEMADGAVKSKAQMLVDAFALVEQAKREAAVSAMVADMEQGQEDFRIQERRDNAAKSQAAAEDAMLTFAAAKAWDDMTTTGSDPAEQSPRQTVADFPNLQRLDKIQTIKDKIAELEAKHFGDLLKPSTIDPIIENADIPKASKTKLKGMSVDGAVTELTALATRTIPKYKKTATELAASLPAMVTAAESTRTAKLTAARNKAAEGNDALAQQYRTLARLTAEPEPAPQPSKAKTPKRTTKTKAKAAQPVQAQPVQAQPVQAQPVQEQPVQAQPVQAQPVQEQPSNSLDALKRAYRELRAEYDDPDTTKDEARVLYQQMDEVRAAIDNTLREQEAGPRAKEQAAKARVAETDRALSTIDDQYSTATAVQNPSTIASIRSALEQRFGKLVTNNLLRSGKVTIEDIPRDGERSDAAAVIRPDGTVTLYANNINEGEASAKLLHEIGSHYGLEQILGKHFDEFYATVQRLATSGDKLAQAAIDRATRAVGEQSKSESVAYFIEGLERSGKRPSLLSNIVAKVKVWLKNSGFGWLTPKFTAKDLVALSNSAIPTFGEGNNNRVANNYQYSFAGRKAKTANLDNLTNAEARIAAGEDAEVVRQETGWHRGVDGKWRFEIDDSNAIFLPAVRKQTGSWTENLDGVIDHPELFNAYPALRGVQVSTVSGLGSVRGDWDATNNVINLNSKLDYTEMYSTLMHEIQHAIQEEENFATGGSLFEFSDDRTTDGFTHARNRASEAREKLSIPDLKAFRSRFYQITNFKFKPFIGITSTPEEIDEIIEPMIEATDAISDDSARQEFLAALNLLETHLLDVLYKSGADKQTGYDKYHALSGEVEARNTQKRLTMNARQRRLTAPSATEDVPSDMQVVRYRTGRGEDRAQYSTAATTAEFEQATQQPEGKRPPRRVLAAAMDALNGFLSRSGFGLGAYAMLAGSVSVVRTVSPEIADRMQEALRRAKEWMRVSTNSVLGTLNRGFDTYKMSDDDKIRTANYVSGEMTLDQIAAQVGKDSGIYKTVVETRAALRAVYEKYVQPAFLHRAIIDITNARDQAAKLDSKAGANVMVKAFSKHFKRVEGESLAAATARGKSLFIIGQDGLPKKTTTIPEGTRAFVMKHDRGSTHFPRVFDYDRIIGDKEGFIKQVLSAKDVDGKPFMESRKEAEALYNTLAANPDSYKQQDFLVRHETVGATRTGREMERAINLPNYVFGDYIIRDVGRSVPVYMQQLMNSAAFIDEFGAITHDSDGNVSINESSNDIANMLNGIPDIAVRQKVKRAVDAMFNPNFQTTRWGREMRVIASVAQFAAALAYMPLIVLSSFPEVANHIAAGRTKLERDVAKKVIWKTITNVFSESGRASNAMMRHRLEALGVINAEIVEHAMHGISQAQEMMGLEGKIKGAMGSFYQRSGITRFTSFQELLAGTIATEVMLTANKVLSDPETSASEKQQAVGTLARATGINPEQYAKLSKAEREALAKDMSAKLSLWQKASDEAGKELNPLDVVDADPALVAATDAVHKAINVGVGIRVAHANAGDVPFYFNDPIFKVVGQFKRFFYGATANVLPNMTANFWDGEWKDARDQFLWFAGVGMSAAAVGLMASHAIKYAAVAGVTGDPQTPFSVWQHKDDFASNLAAESALYATSGLVAATPYIGMMERPGGLLEPLNWAASAGLMTTVVNNPISLVDNAGMAAAVWLGGDMIAKRMDNKYKSNLDKANQLGYKGRYTEGL